MRFLSEGLNKVGFESVALSLPTTFSSVEDCAALLDRKLEGFAKSYEKINYVGNSMGGLIIRKYINAYKPANVGKCVFIATPHRGSRLARMMLYVPCVSILVPPLADLESKKENEYLLKDRNLAVGIIVGSENSLLWGKLFLSDQSDGRVEIKSAISEDAKETVVLPYHHEEIHHVPETLKLVKRFIESGTFGSSGHSTR
jgi:pimeloyl-ACP methyl ester carboxylesterase